MIKKIVRFLNTPALLAPHADERPKTMIAAAKVFWPYFLPIWLFPVFLVVWSLIVSEESVRQQFSLWVVPVFFACSACAALPWLNKKIRFRHDFLLSGFSMLIWMTLVLFRLLFVLVQVIWRAHVG